MILLQKPAGTAVANVEMTNPGFCRNLQHFPKEDVSKQTLNTSKAGAMLAEWINAIYKFALISQEVHPLQEEIVRVQAEYDEKKWQMKIQQDRRNRL